MKFSCNWILHIILHPRKLGVRPLISAKEVEKIHKLLALHRFLGKALHKEFPKVFNYLRLPNSLGISPLKLSLLKSRNVKFGSIGRACGIEQIKLLLSMWTLMRELQLASDGGRVLINLLLKRFNVTRLLPLQMYIGIEPYGEFLEMSSL